MKIAARCLLLLLVWSCNSDPDVSPERNNRLQVYPSPFRDVAYVRFDNPSGKEFTLVFFGTKGEVLFERKENVTEGHYQFNVSDEPKGTYHVIVESGGATFTRRVFKM